MRAKHLTKSLCAGNTSYTSASGSPGLGGAQLLGRINPFSTYPSPAWHPPSGASRQHHLVDISGTAFSQVPPTKLPCSPLNKCLKYVLYI